MERQTMIDAIVDYAERHDLSDAGLWLLVGDITGTHVDTALDGEVFSRLSPSELESVYEVVLTHNHWDHVGRAAS